MEAFTREETSKRYENMTLFSVIAPSILYYTNTERNTSVVL